MKPGSLVVAVAVSIELLALCGIAAAGDLHDHVVPFLVLFAVASAALFCAWHFMRAAPTLGVVVIVALALRLPMLWTQPNLSDDVWRYLHDGRAQSAGVNPYDLPPSDPRTAPYRGPEFDRINHPDLVTIYPPVAQAAFYLNAVLGSHLLVWRLILIVCELVALVALARLLQRRGRKLSNLVLYAWHPLAVVEVAGSAHLEPVGIALLLAGMLAAERGRQIAAGALVGLSVAFKLVAAPILALATELQKPRVLGAVVAAVLLSYAPYASGPAFGSLPVFAASWEANPSTYALLNLVLDGHRARIFAATLLVCALAIIRQSRADTHDRAAMFLLALMLLAPVVHPWYLLWLLAFVPLMTDHQLRRVTLIWSGTIAFAYAGGVFVLVEYTPVYGALLSIAFTRARWRSRSRNATPSEERRPQIPA